MENFLVDITHIILGVILFFLINWIGKNSFSVGYMQISVFVKEDSAPAFNSLVRILTPIVYLLIISLILYELSLDTYVHNIYLVSVYYLCFRLIFNLVTNRGLLINWWRQLFYWVSIISLSYYIYYELIIEKKNLFPDLSTWTNEIWIIVLIFIYNVFNRLKLSQKNTIRRKERYIRNRYEKFNKKYGNIINSSASNIKLKSTIYAIMIYEDFNRPKLVRLLEYIFHVFSKKEFTLGLMQIKSNKLITDKESVELGVDKIVNKYTESVATFKANKKKREQEQEDRKHQLFIESGIKVPEVSLWNDDSDWLISHDLIKDYNPDDEYISEVRELMELLMKMNYPDSNIKLYE